MKSHKKTAAKSVHDPLKMLEDANDRARLAADAVKKAVAESVPDYPRKMLQGAENNAQAAANTVQRAVDDAYRH